MSDRANEVKQAPGQAAASLRLRARYLRQRTVVIAIVWLMLVVFSSHWVLTLIGTFFALFIVFGIDDEMQALEREQHDPIEC